MKPPIRERIAIVLLLIVIAVILFGSIALSGAAHALGGNVGRMQSSETGTCYQVVREKRTFDDLYKSNSLYRYHLVAPISCGDYRLPPDPYAERHARWGVYKIHIPGAGMHCFDALYMPIQDAVYLRQGREMSVGQEISCYAN